MDSYERVGGEEFIHVPLQELLLPLLLFFLCVIKGRAAVSAQPKTISKFSHFPKRIRPKNQIQFSVDNFHTVVEKNLEERVDF